MTDLVWDFEVDGGNFELAGSASQTTKSRLKQLGLPNETVRKVIIAMYEGEINMVIHADGGVATVTVGPKEIKVVLKDTGKGIENIPLAMKEGYSTASSEIRDLGFGAGHGLAQHEKIFRRNGYTVDGGRRHHHHHEVRHLTQADEAGENGRNFQGGHVGRRQMQGLHKLHAQMPRAGDKGAQRQGFD